MNSIFHTCKLDEDMKIVKCDKRCFICINDEDYQYPLLYFCKNSIHTNEDLVKFYRSNIEYFIDLNMITHKQLLLTICQKSFEKLLNTLIDLYELLFKYRCLYSSIYAPKRIYVSGYTYFTIGRLETIGEIKLALSRADSNYKDNIIEYCKSVGILDYVYD